MTIISLITSDEDVLELREAGTIKHAVVTGNITTLDLSHSTELETFIYVRTQK